MTSYEELKEKYWRVVSRTRMSGRISQSVKEREEAYWCRFPASVVEEALRIHISRYPEYKECYTRGIMRNLNGKRETAPVKQNQFQDFEQRDYDFDELEKQLLEN